MELNATWRQLDDIEILNPKGLNDPTAKSHLFAFGRGKRSEALRALEASLAGLDLLITRLHNPLSFGGDGFDLGVVIFAAIMTVVKCWVCVTSRGQTEARSQM